MHRKRLPAVSLAGPLLVALWMRPALATDDECRVGERLFEDSKTEESAAQRIAMLERSTALCPRFAGHYALGRERLALGDADAASRSFDSALRLAASPLQEMLAFGRLAEARQAQGRTGEAVSAMESAWQRLAAIQPARPAPDWLGELRRQLDRQIASGVVRADTLRSILHPATTRGIGVVPRVQLPVQFAYDSAELTHEGSTQVSELHTALATPKVLTQQQRIRIVGHTDARGSDAYNDRLSLARAVTVARTLEAQLPELAGRIDIEGHGKRELRYPGDDEESHRLNRRVEITLESQP